MDEDPDRAQAIVELEDRILESAAAARESGRVSRTEVKRRYEIPTNVLDRLEEIGVLNPNSRGYDADDVAIIEAISRFRAAATTSSLASRSTTRRYREALAPLVEEEVRTLLDRLAGEVEVDRAAEIIAAGAEPLRELIGAVHSSSCSRSCAASAAGTPESRRYPRPRGGGVGPVRRRARGHAVDEVGPGGTVLLRLEVSPRSCSSRSGDRGRAR